MLYVTISNQTTNNHAYMYLHHKPLTLQYGGTRVHIIMLRYRYLHFSILTSLAINCMAITYNTYFCPYHQRYQLYQASTEYSGSLPLSGGIGIEPIGAGVCEFRILIVSELI
uniref:Uncharacterized protein n=1 Tax=Cacopsylla melanoneura TaxID=428564 RepID=A0A8D8ZAI5_9HEMI